tara:strand:- start:8108 stop:9025 length:918 start_codon:yes stop_codon:yes gene_type:complete
MKILVTGANGFLARNLIEYYSKDNNSILGLTRNLLHTNVNKTNLVYKKYNPSKSEYLIKLVKEFKPDLLFHTAAQSNPTLSWKQPLDTLTDNVNLTYSLINSIAITNSPCKFILFSSSSIYRESRNKIKESSSLSVNTPYALSKYSQEKITEMFAMKHNIPFIIIRPFCITGPKKFGDVCNDWAKGVASLIKNNKQVLKVGNIKGVTRDFLHIHDFLSALDLIVTVGRRRVYNICSASPMKLSNLINLFRKASGLNFDISCDIDKMRSVNDSSIVGDNSRLVNLGWKKKINNNSLIEELIKSYIK